MTKGIESFDDYQAKAAGAMGGVAEVPVPRGSGRKTTFSVAK